MSFANGLTITNKGKALQAKAQTGVVLNFSRLAAGDGNYSGDIAALNALVSQKLTIPINKLATQSGGKTTVGGVLTNSGLATGFYFRELGLFANDPDEGEILYCYTNAGSGAEFIPAQSGAESISKQIDILSIVGQAANVTATIDESLLFVTLDQFEGHVSDGTLHIPFVVAGGAANVYTATLPYDFDAYFNGQAAAVEIPANNTGGSTIDFNGKGAAPLVTSKGTALPPNKLVAGAVVSVRYSSVFSAFQLQGEGGEYGTAGAGDVRAGKSIGTDNGLVNGAIPVQNPGAVNASKQNVTLPAGIYDNPIQVTGGIDTSDATAAAGDIRAGKSAYINAQKVIGTKPVQATAPLTVTPGDADAVLGAGIYDAPITVKAGYAKGSTIDVGAIGQAIVQEYQDSMPGFTSNVNIQAVSANYLYLSNGMLVNRANPSAAVWTNSNVLSGAVIDEARGFVVGLYNSGSGIRVLMYSLATGTQLLANSFPSLGTTAFTLTSNNNVIYLPNTGIYYALLGYTSNSNYYLVKADVSGTTIVTASLSVSYNGTIYYDSDAPMIYHFKSTTGPNNVLIISTDLVQQGSTSFYDNDGTTAISFVSVLLRMKDGKSIIGTANMPSGTSAKMDLKNRKVIWKWADNTLAPGMEFADGTILVSYGTIGAYAVWQRMDTNGNLLPGISRNYNAARPATTAGKDSYSDRFWTSFNSAWCWVKTKFQIN